MADIFPLCADLNRVGLCTLLRYNFYNVIQNVKKETQGSSRGLLRVWRHLQVERTYCSDAVLVAPVRRFFRQQLKCDSFLFPQSGVRPVWTLSSVAGNR